MMNPFPQYLSDGASLNGHDQVSVWGKLLLFTSLHLFLTDLLTFLQKLRRHKATPIKQLIWCSGGTSKTQLCVETKSEERRKKYADNKIYYICPSSLHNSWLCEVPDYSEDNFRAEMRCSVGGRATRRQFLPPYLGFCGKLVSCRSNSCRKRKVHLFRPTSMT